MIESNDYSAIPHDLAIAGMFAALVKGDSMKGANIEDGDHVVIDATPRALEECVGKVIFASVDGKNTIKRLSINDNGYMLKPENPKYEPYYIQPYEHFQCLGVITSVFKSVK